MFKDVMREVWSTWGNTYYVNIFVLFCQLIALTSAIANYKKQIERATLLAYIILSILLSTAHTYYTNYTYLTGADNELRLIKFEEVQVFFEWIEFSAICIFFYRLYRNERTRYLLTSFYVFFTFVIAWLFIRVESGALLPEVWHLSFFISTIEMTFLAILSLIYFYRLLKLEPVFNLFERPSFWITTGILFYSAIIVPFFLVAGYIIQTSFRIMEYGFLVHLFLFGILFFLFEQSIFIEKTPYCMKPVIEAIRNRSFGRGLRGNYASYKPSNYVKIISSSFSFYFSTIFLLRGEFTKRENSLTREIMIYNV